MKTFGELFDAYEAMTAAAKLGPTAAVGGQLAELGKMATAFREMACARERMLAEAMAPLAEAMRPLRKLAEKIERQDEERRLAINKMIEPIAAEQARQAAMIRSTLDGMPREMSLASIARRIISGE